jgi:hypothetical protein
MAGGRRELVAGFLQLVGPQVARGPWLQARQARRCIGRFGADTVRRAARDRTGLFGGGTLGMRGRASVAVVVSAAWIPPWPASVGCLGRVM